MRLPACLRRVALAACCRALLITPPRPTSLPFHPPMHAGKTTPEGSLVRLTGCWSERYEFKWWSNVVCVPREHPIYPEMERMSFRFALQKEHYYTSGS